MGQQGRGEGGGAGQGRVSGLKRSCVAGPLCLSTYSLTRYNCLSNSFFRAQGYSRRVFLFQLFADLSELSTFFGGSAGNVLAMGSSLLAPRRVFCLCSAGGRDGGRAFSVGFDASCRDWAA